MDNKRLESKLDKIVEEIAEIKQTLAVNTKELEIHVEGVILAREQNNILRQEMENRFDSVDSDLKPIKSHVAFVKGAIWSLGIAGAIVLGLNELGIIQKLL